MKRFNRYESSFLLFVVLVVFVTIMRCARADAVVAANVTITNLRDTASIELASAGVFFQGDSILLTNCVIYTGSTTSSPVQNLDGVAITVTVGSETLTVTNTGTAMVTNLGTWWATSSIPVGVNPAYIEVTVSNESIYTHQWQKLSTKVHLGE